MGDKNSPVTLDMSKAQPITQSVSLDMSKAQPINGHDDQPEPGIWDKIKKVLTPRDVPRATTEEINKSPLPGSFEGHPENIGEYIPATIGQAASGVGDIAQGNVARGAHKIISGGMNAMLPAAPILAAGAPAAFATSLAAGSAGQYLAKKGATSLGASPDQADLAGDVGGIVGGIAGGKAANLPETIRANAPGLTVAANKLRTVPPAAEMQPALENTPEEIINYAAQKGIKLTPGQATSSPVARTVEAIGERSLLGGDELANAKQGSATQLAKNVRGIADTADPKGMGLSEEQAGETIQQTAQVAREVAQNNASEAYKQLPQDRMQNPIDISQIRSAYFQKLKQMEVSLANRNPQVADQIRGVLEQGSNLGTPATGTNGQPYVRPELTFKDLMKVRSDAIADGGAMARAGAPSEVQGLYRGLASDVDSVMASEAQKQGFAADWRQANAGWKDYLNKYDDPQSPLYRILNQRDPARVTRDILTRGSAADVEAMKNESMQPALEALKRQTIIDISNRGFKVTGDGLGGYSDAFLHTLFGAAGKKELYLNGELARRMGFQQNPSGTSNVMLGADQLSATPSKWMAPVGAARLSMPRSANSFIPKATPKLALPQVAGATSLLLGEGNQSQ